MDVLEIRSRVTGQTNDDGDRIWEDRTVLHRNTDAKTVCREYYPNYKLGPHHTDVDNEPIPVARSLNPNVMEVHHYDIVPQKEKGYDPHAPASDVDSELVEIP